MDCEDHCLCDYGYDKKLDPMKWVYGETRRVYRHPETPYLIICVPSRHWSGDLDHPRATNFQVGYEWRDIVEDPDGLVEVVVWEWIATFKQLSGAIGFVQWLQFHDDEMDEPGWAAFAP